MMWLTFLGDPSVGRSGRSGRWNMAAG